MDIKIYPSTLDGEIDAVSSKSVAHRMFIAASLAESNTIIYLKDKSKDIDATIKCISALGGEITRDFNSYTVKPIDILGVKKARVYDCGESGSTLRFMFPIVCALGAEGTFIGEGRLPDRPIKELTSIIKGCNISADNLPILVDGKMNSGVFRIKGNVSSQYISGLLFSLPLLENDSEIILTSPLESKPYIDMTIDVLIKFGVNIEATENGYKVKGGQKYISPKTLEVEGDWSNAAFWLTASAIGNLVKVNNLDNNSKQGDKNIKKLILAFSAKGTEIDAKEIPDLVPVLAVLAAYASSKTTIYNAERLRLKESDRLLAMRENLNRIGGEVVETPSGLIINGKGGLDGGETDGFNDHRIVMAIAIAATKAKNPTIIHGAEAVEKSYPNFFKDFKKLGGKYDVL